MHWRVGICGVLLLAAASRLSGAERTLSFGEFALNQPPPGFRSTLAGTGEPGEWKVVMDEVPTLFEPVTPRATGTYQKKVLAQVSRDTTDEHFPMLIWEEPTFGDFKATVKVRMVDGQAEQMAGLAFRYQDERNYYYIRASALGNTFYFFKVVNGIRSAPAGGKVEIPSGQWHDLTVECEGNRIRGLLNGQEIIEPLQDFTFTSGKIGFWTKSDSVSHFADLHLTYKPLVPLAQTMVNQTMETFERLIELSMAATPGKDQPIRIIASSNPEKIGQPAFEEAAQVLQSGTKYYGRTRETVAVTMPLADKNGFPMAAVRVVMERFPGQTEKNALARVIPIMKSMEFQALTVEELLQ